ATGHYDGGGLGLDARGDEVRELERDPRARREAAPERRAGALPAEARRRGQVTRGELRRREGGRVGERVGLEAGDRREGRRAEEGQREDEHEEVHEARSRPAAPRQPALRLARREPHADRHRRDGSAHRLPSALRNRRWIITMTSVSAARNIAAAAAKPTSG